MGNFNSNVVTHFRFYRINYHKNSFRVFSNSKDENLCPLDIIFDSPEPINKIKIFQNNSKPFEIYGLKNILLSHNGGSSYLQTIQDKINNQKNDFFIITWKEHYTKKDLFLQTLNKKHNFNVNYFSGKELKIFFNGMGSLGSMKISDEDKKYTFLPTNLLVMKYNKFVIYDEEANFLYKSTSKSIFEFTRSRSYVVAHFYAVR